MGYLKILAFIAMLACLIAAILFLAYKRTQREIRLRIKAEQEMKKLAFYDALTGLGNRHHFFILANHSLKQAERENSQLIVVYMDLDDFKTINDRYGHQAGDFVLVHVGNVIRRFVRQSDIAARIGGDEFVLMFLHIHDMKLIQAILEKISKKISEPVVYQDTLLSVSASIGWAVSPQDGLDIDSLLEKADTEMYQFKFERKQEVL